MRADHLDACLIAATPNIYYLSMRVFRGYIWVPAEGNVKYFIVRPVNIGGPDTVQIHKPEQIPTLLKENALASVKRIGLEFGELFHSEILRLNSIFEGYETADCTMTLKRARMVKTDWEISEMKKDGVLHAYVYGKTREFYQPGMTDTELQIALETEMRLRGCLGFPRVSGRMMQINLGSVISGDNADVPTPYDFSMGGRGVDTSLPVGADGKEMRRGSVVMIDMNGAFNGYQSDMTRTWRIGPVSDIAVKAHECSRRILRELEQLGRPGTPVSELYIRAERIADEEGLKQYFMGHCQQVAFIGHGVGIELNEIPVVMRRSRDVLTENMTIALEPKFVIPDIGAVGVENTYRVTDSGLENLTVFPEDLEDLL